MNDSLTILLKEPQTIHLKARGKFSHLDPLSLGMNGRLHVLLVNQT